MEQFADRKKILVTAYHTGRRIYLRGIAFKDRLAEKPLAMRAGASGLAVLFRHGAVVCLGMTVDEQRAFLAGPVLELDYPLDPHTEEEEAILNLAPGSRDLINDEGAIQLADFSLERLLVVADVLAKSVTLEHYEAVVGEAADKVAPMARDLTSKGRFPSRQRGLIKHIGHTLLIQNHLVGRAEVLSKPELLWDRPDLERLHRILAEEYELDERRLLVEQKLELISRTANTLLELLQDRRTLRVEWYIVVLIVVEIVISVYELLRH